jgi:aerobic-type carbon monoxide dehydrogenase small subunit (CoxS/CutS family)
MHATHIYCDNCESVQPIVIEPAEEAVVNDKFTDARALQCGNCGAVIAITFVSRIDPE